MINPLGVLGGMRPLATVDFLRKPVRNAPAAADQEHIPARFVGANEALALAAIGHCAAGKA